MLKLMIVLTGILFVSTSQVAIAKGHSMGFKKEKQSETSQQKQEDVLTQQENKNSELEQDQVEA